VDTETLKAAVDAISAADYSETKWPRTVDDGWFKAAVDAISAADYSETKWPKAKL
jgi:hypothetical protein